MVWASKRFLRGNSTEILGTQDSPGVPTKRFFWMLGWTSPSLIGSVDSQSSDTKDGAKPRNNTGVLQPYWGAGPWKYLYGWENNQMDDSSFLVPRFPSVKFTCWSGCCFLSVSILWDDRPLDQRVSNCRPRCHMFTAGKQQHLPTASQQLFCASWNH